MHCYTNKDVTHIASGGIAPPVHEWKVVLDEMNAQTRRLEEDYEGTCIQKKVSGRWLTPSSVIGQGREHAESHVLNLVELKQRNDTAVCNSHRESEELVKDEIAQVLLTWS